MPIRSTNFTNCEAQYAISCKWKNSNQQIVGYTWQKIFAKLWIIIGKEKIVDYSRSLDMEIRYSENKINFLSKSLADCISKDTNTCRLKNSLDVNQAPANCWLTVTTCGSRPLICILVYLLILDTRVAFAWRMTH